MHERLVRFFDKPGETNTEDGNLCGHQKSVGRSRRGSCSCFCFRADCGEGCRGVKGAKTRNEGGMRQRSSVLEEGRSTVPISFDCEQGAR